MTLQKMEGQPKRAEMRYYILQKEKAWVDTIIHTAVQNMVTAITNKDNRSSENSYRNISTRHKKHNERNKHQ